MLDERNYWLAFSAFSGIGPIKFKKLLAQFGSAKDAWRVSASDLRKVLGEKLAERFDKFRASFSTSDYVKRLDREGVSFVIATDREYPELLSQIKNPPFLLYTKGNVNILCRHLTKTHDRGKLLNDAGLEPAGSGIATHKARTIKPTIAVVGARKTTQYGREVTKILTEQLVSNGFVIVSGLAIGIDAISHRTAIENNGKTIAVLGCGVDCCYPKENQSIYNSIVDGSGLAKPDPVAQGCIVSEYPLGFRPTRRSFPIRNRIIAGLSLGVLVTEGAEDSGALITADYARKFGRPVFAVPGPITSSLSKGPYKLIQKGAKIVTKFDDILKEFKIQSNNLLRIKINPSADVQNSKVRNATKEESMILNILRNEPLTFDELVKRTGFDSAKVGSLLSLMEIKGIVRDLENGSYSV